MTRREFRPLGSGSGTADRWYPTGATRREYKPLPGIVSEARLDVEQSRPCRVRSLGGDTLPSHAGTPVAWQSGGPYSTSGVDEHHANHDWLFPRDASRILSLDEITFTTALHTVPEHAERAVLYTYIAMTDSVSLAVAFADSLLPPGGHLRRGKLSAITVPTGGVRFTNSTTPHLDAYQIFVDGVDVTGAVVDPVQQIATSTLYGLTWTRAVRPITHVFSTPVTVPPGATVDFRLRFSAHAYSSIFVHAAPPYLARSYYTMATAARPKPGRYTFDASGDGDELPGGQSSVPLGPSDGWSYEAMSTPLSSRVTHDATGDWIEFVWGNETPYIRMSITALKSRMPWVHWAFRDVRYHTTGGDYLPEEMQNWSYGGLPRFSRAVWSASESETVFSEMAIPGQSRDFRRFYDPHTGSPVHLGFPTNVTLRRA